MFHKTIKVTSVRHLQLKFADVSMHYVPQHLWDTKRHIRALCVTIVK